VVEAQNARRELFGFDRTAAISNQSADSIARAAEAHGQNDDITVLTLRFAPDAESHFAGVGARGLVKQHENGFLDLSVYWVTALASMPPQVRHTHQKLRKRNSLAQASTFSRIASSGNIRAISMAPIMVEKMEKKARSLSAVRWPGINGSI